MTNEHDQLCPHREFIPGSGVWVEGFSDPPNPVQSYEPCQCDLIAKVRADELENAAKRVMVALHNWTTPCVCMSITALHAVFKANGGCWCGQCVAAREGTSDE